MRNFTILVGLLLFPAITWAAAGQVESVGGKVWDIRANQQIILASGDEVQAGDVVRTGRTGQVRLVMQDDSVVVLGPRSRLRIERYDMDQHSLLAGSFYLLWGKVRFLVSKLKRATASFSVSTQTANIGVRGTEFGVIVPPPESGESPYTDAMLFKGAIVGRSLGNGIVVIKPGQFVHFTVSGAPQVRNITPADVERLGIHPLAPGLVEPKPVFSVPQPVHPDNDNGMGQGMGQGMSHRATPAVPNGPGTPAIPAHPVIPAQAQHGTGHTGKPAVPPGSIPKP
jgi:FecR protein